MDGVVLTRLLLDSNDNSLRKLFAAEEKLANRANWSAKDVPHHTIDAIPALAQAVHQATKRVVWQRCLLTGSDKAMLIASPAKIRESLFPESCNWISYAEIGKATSSVQLQADGDRLTSNLTLSDEGSDFDSMDGVGGLARFCDANLGLLQAVKAANGNWQVSVYRLNSATEQIEHCSLGNISGLHFEPHPDATCIIRLFKYRLPIGGRSVIAKDLLDKLQQTIHDSIIPFSVNDRAERYSFDRFLQKFSLGLDFKLQRSNRKQMAYAQTATLTGKTIRTYLFKLRFERQHEQTTRHTLKQLYFRGDRHIVFLKQGMVVGELGADFIEYTAGLKHLRDHLLVSLSEVESEEMEGLKAELADYLKRHSELQKLNDVYNEKLTFN